MKLYRLLYFSFLILLLGGCAISKWKETLVSTGDVNDAINNVITDFSNTSKLSKQDSVFGVHVTDLNKDIIIVGIMGATNMVYPRPENTVGTYDDIFPSQYLIKDNKLFYWSDSTQIITQDMINMLDKYNHIDFNWQEEWEIPPYVIDDGKEGVVYYICKNNYMNYKKTGANNINKHYSVPKLNCNK